MTDALYSSCWRSPSNIALVKYWGKKPGQIPFNASISFTLSNCYSETILSAFKKADHLRFSIELLLDGKPEPSFIPKIKSFFEHIESEMPLVGKYHWKIETRNTFPHSSGIASSASGMSALTLCLLSIAEKSGHKTDDFIREASFLSRIGSGSACRSVYGGFNEWGLHPDCHGSSDLFAINLDHVHPVFADYCDTILIVHEGPKTVSSSIGHSLIGHHVFASSRFEHAQKQVSKLKGVLASGDIEAFTGIVESEALMLHAMMMTSDPCFILMKPQTLAIIESIWEYRKQKNNSFAFTLDAGANVHFLYTKADEANARKFIKDELLSYCHQGRFIDDQVGSGPVQIS
jgi:diphosphomevalonate decarboxylase